MTIFAIQRFPCVGSSSPFFPHDRDRLEVETGLYSFIHFKQKPQTEVDPKIESLGCLGFEKVLLGMKGSV